MRRDRHFRLRRFEQHVPTKEVASGVDTDSLVLASDRFDGTHFSASGQEKFADAWVALLRARN